MNLPWWSWLLIALWCAPAIYSTVQLLWHKPMLALDENGEPPKPVSLHRKLIAFPLVLAIMVLVWPWLFWSEYRRSRK